MGFIDWLKDKVGLGNDAPPAKTITPRRDTSLWSCARCKKVFSGGAVCPYCKRDNSKEPTVDDPAERQLTIAKGAIVTVVVISGVIFWYAGGVTWIAGLVGTGGIAQTATAAGVGLVAVNSASADEGDDSITDGQAAANPYTLSPLPAGPRSYHVFKGQVSWQGSPVLTNHDFGGSDLLLVYEVAGNVAQFREAVVIIGGGGTIKVGERFGPVDSGRWYNWSNRHSLKPTLTTPLNSNTTTVSGSLESNAQNQPQYSFQASRFRVLTFDEYSDGLGDVYKQLVDAAYQAKPAKYPNLPPRYERPSGKPTVPQF